MLSIEGLYAAYGKVSALENVSLKVEPGQIVCLLGANGAGKTTTLNCVSGLVAATAGRIAFEGEDIGNLRAEDVVKRGLVQVPEGREIFAAMSVEDNLMLGAWHHRDRRRNHNELQRVYDLFPRLRERASQFAGTLSGGEQQMLMIGRALMAKPEAADIRRAEPRPIADPGSAGVRHHPGDPCRRHADPAGGAECADGA